MLSAQPETARRIATDTNRHLVALFTQAGATRILDVGCGAGDTCAHLAHAGFDPVGIDPSAGAIARAKSAHPKLAFEQATALDWSYAPAPFDAAVLVNALHHIAPDEMVASLRRVLSHLDAGGILAIIEPLPEGNFFDAMLPVEDETEIRRLAAESIARFIDQGDAELVDLVRWDRISNFSGLEPFLNRLTEVEPERLDQIASNRPAIEQAWATHARPQGQGYQLIQPIACWVLRAPR